MTGPRLASRVMKARRESVCPLCREPVKVGQLIALTTKWAHAGCVVASLYTEVAVALRKDCCPDLL